MASILFVYSDFMPDRVFVKKEVAVVGRESNAECSLSAQVSAGVPLTDKFPFDLPISGEAVVEKQVMARAEAQGTEANDDSENVFVGGTLPNLAACESEVVIFEKAIGKTGIISETDTVLDLTGLPLC